LSQVANNPHLPINSAPLSVCVATLTARNRPTSNDTSASSGFTSCVTTAEVFEGVLVAPQPGGDRLIEQQFGVLMAAPGRGASGSGPDGRPGTPLQPNPPGPGQGGYPTASTRRCPTQSAARPITLCDFAGDGPLHGLQREAECHVLSHLIAEAAAALTKLSNGDGRVLIALLIDRRYLREYSRTANPIGAIKR
jgi:hypothetical protein